MRKNNRQDNLGLSHRHTFARFGAMNWKCQMCRISRDGEHVKGEAMEGYKVWV